MISLKKTLKVLTEKVKALDTALSVDYIVEQGTEGIWTYRKWNSGIAECWGTYAYNNVGTGIVWGKPLYIASTSSPRIDYPFAFVERPKEMVFCRLTASACWVLGESDGGSVNTTTRTAVYTPIKVNGFVDGTIYMDFTVIGRWK